MSSMDYYPVSYWDVAAEQWVECGRFYRRTLVIDYKLISDDQFDFTVSNHLHDELPFTAAPIEIPKDVWAKAPGSSTWGLIESKASGMYVLEDGNKSAEFGIDLPDVSNQSSIIAYYVPDCAMGGQLLSDREAFLSKVYLWKSWNQPLTLSTLFDVYHDSINVKDISR
ncbi:MAG: hypothetical protein ACTSPB_02710 [Candidatus Thorarchaeota archaeon]